MRSGAAISIFSLPLCIPETRHLRERKIDMLKQALILRNPLGQLGFETDDILPAGAFGAVMAHAGVGKTALLVQLALNAMLRERKVLHLSLNDPVNKVNLWYQELFQNLAAPHEGRQIEQLWDSVSSYRFIMTFRVESFSVPKLEERLNDLTEQGIFRPELLIVDGFHCEGAHDQMLANLKELTGRIGIPAWFTVHAHGNEKAGQDGLPPSFSPVAGRFDLILELQSERADVHIRVLKGARSISSQGTLLLDPSTMLIKDRG